MSNEEENPNAGIWQQILSESTTAEGVSIDGRAVVVLGTCESIFWVVIRLFSYLGLCRGPELWKNFPVI